ncbi:hypothetical protein EDB87DRAFT_1608249 [Lactarius vividus]|nr:hypothetical protein EDB87DRAFT_1608249 [Lactarius vividus]
METIPQVFVSGLNAVAVWRYSMIDVVCFYDWVISLDQEVALIYPTQWNGVKAAYLFCRYYPMAIAPFHLWGLVGNHEQRVCESYYHVLFACSMPTLLITLGSVVSSVILMLRTYAFSERNTRVLVALSITYLGLAGVIIWVLSKGLTLIPLFSLTKRTACFAISGELNNTLPAASVVQGNSPPVPIAYHIGVLVTFFDCLNILVVLWHWVRGRDTFGLLAKSFLKQGILVYVVMTAMNALAICTFLSSYLGPRGLNAITLLANILPSALVIRFLSHLPLLMLRQKASPTETKLRLEHSHMIDDALEMIAMERRPEEISEGFTPSISTDTEAQP